MAFVALVGGKRLCTLGQEPHVLHDLLSAFGKEDKLCQSCKAPVFLRCGGRRPHFSHYPSSRPDSCKTGPESVEHLESKAEIARMLKKAYIDLGLAVSVDPEPRVPGGIRIELEVSLPDGERIADVMVSYPGGAQHAHEAQLAAIGMAELQKRTTDYHARGIDVTWYLGGSACTDSNVQWCHEKLGNCYSLAVSPNYNQDLRP